MNIFTIENNVVGTVHVGTVHVGADLVSNPSAERVATSRTSEYYLRLLVLLGMNIDAFIQVHKNV